MLYYSTNNRKLYDKCISKSKTSGIAGKMLLQKLNTKKEGL